MSLNGKILLFLGGTSRARFVIERAQKHGIYVIVADYTDTNPAKEIADEAIKVDATDVDALEAICREKKVDGIITAYVDVLLQVCKKLSDKLGLPCYYTESMLKASTDKFFFKGICQKYGVSVPSNITISDSKSIEVEAIEFPVFIKPLDASGSRGAGVCYNKLDFIKQYKEAETWSYTNTVVVEELLHGQEFILDYYVIDGTPYLLSMGDRYIIEGRNLAVNSPNLMVFPSKYLSRYNEEINPLVTKMYKSEGFNEGLMFMQGYANEDKISFYEMGCRLGGTWPYIDEYYHGINPMDMLFNHALTGCSLDEPVNGRLDANFRGNAAIIYFLAGVSEGVIAKICGVDKLETLPFVVHVMQYYFEGDRFDMNRKTDVRFLAVHLVANSFVELKERINNVYGLVGYYDDKGESLLSPLYDVNKLEGYK